MIRNLNRLNFKGYGSVSLERAPDNGQSAKSMERQTLHLSQGEVPIYRAVSEVWLNYSTGMTVLSVSQDGRDFQHFYLDKPVYIQPDIYYCLSPCL